MARGGALTPEFEICAEEREGVVLLTLRGELDLATVAPLRESIAAVAWSNRPEVIVDLHDVTFIDATGLRVLVEAGREARRAGRPLSMVPGPPNVQRVFVLTLTLDVFEWLDPPTTA